MKKAPVVLVLFAILFTRGLLADNPVVPDLGPLKRWISEQKDVQAISADFTQTRTLHALRSPISSNGRLWLIAPDWFRWELGEPPKMIIIGTPQHVTIIQPSKKRAERKPRTTLGILSESAMLGMMRFPGGGGFAEFQRHVRVLILESSGSRCHLEMLPRDVQAARGIAAIKWDFDTVTGHWLSFDIVTQEGSSIRNTFRNVQINPKLNKQLFQYDLTGFQVIDEKN